MAKSKKPEQNSTPRHHGVSLRKLSTRCTKICRDGLQEKRRVKASENKEWDDALCSVCMEHPHNAVLLLCSSYNKGCRPYMCATSSRYSNCLDQYKKAYTKETDDDLQFSEQKNWANGKTEIPELLCPLCRGQVKGWTVVDPARKYLNAKKRTCMKDNCSFLGTYKELRKHVKLEHPLSRPRAIDPSHVEKWKKLENERDLSDVFSTIRSTMPGAIVIGDYVIERNHRGDEFFDDAIFRFPTYPRFPHDSSEGVFDPLDDHDDFGRIRGRGAVGSSRRWGNNASRIARPHARLWVSRRAVRLRGGR